MNKIAIATLFALSTTPAFGSYMESCVFTTVVEETAVAPALDGTVSAPTRLVKLEIIGAVDQGSYSPTACQDRVGSSPWLTIASDRVLTPGQSLVIDYFYFNSRGPNGQVNSESWTVVDDNAGDLVVSCIQVDRSLPNYTVEIRASYHPTISEPQYALYVTEDQMGDEGGQTIIDGDRAVVTYLSNHQGGIETLYTGQEASLDLQPATTENGQTVARGLMTLGNLGVVKAMHCTVFN